MGVPDVIDALDRLTALFPEALAQARATGRAVLVSVAERVTELDPLDVLEALYDHRASLRDCMYWSRPDDGFALAGLGAALTLAPAGATRFATADRAWRALLADALTDAPDDVPGAAPVLMGGFSFDPDGPRTTEWRDFAATSLTLPRVQIATSGDTCWITTNVLVRPDDEDVDAAAALELRARALAARARSAGRARPRSARVECVDARPAAEWRALVREAATAVRDGALEKVVLAREVRTSAAHAFDVIAMLHHLRAAHPTCYVFACWRGDSAFVGASPERLVRLDERDVRASSLAGSVRRGATREEDETLAAELLASEKDRVEHEIVRRTLCTGLARLCDDVTCASEPSLLSLPQVHHLHTAVRARLRGGHSLLELVGALHPTPAVGGAPRETALRFIREREQLDRGWYAAPIGWVQRDRGEFAVGLRSALVTGARASLFAGCGIVGDSDPAQEYAESLIKLRPMEVALAAALAARHEDAA